MENFPKFQYSQFDKLDGQYVVRTDDQEEFKKLVALVKMATGNAFASKTAPQTPKSAPTSVEKPKVAYMWSGDPCPVCGHGVMTRTLKTNKAGEKYDALICDQKDCTGYAYLSKFPKKFEATGQVDFSKESDLPF